MQRRSSLVIFIHVHQKDRLHGAKEGVVRLQALTITRPLQAGPQQLRLRQRSTAGRGGLMRMAWGKLDNDGYIGLPPGPGLGVDIDEKRLEEEAKRPQTYRWPGARLRDGSIADY